MVVELEVLKYMWSEMIVRSPKSARRACPSWSMRILAFMGSTLEGRAKVRIQSDTPFKSPCIISWVVCTSTHEQLPRGIVRNSHDERWEWDRTSSNGFASQFSLTKSLIFRFTIHSDIVTTSLQNPKIVYRSDCPIRRDVFDVPTTL